MKTLYIFSLFLAVTFFGCADKFPKSKYGMESHAMKIGFSTMSDSLYFETANETKDKDYDDLAIVIDGEQFRYATIQDLKSQLEK